MGALSGMDAKLVTSQADFEAVNGAIGKLIASVPQSQVMDVYNAMAKIVSPVIPNNLLSTVNGNDAQAAYDAFLKFKDVEGCAAVSCLVPPVSGVRAPLTAASIFE